MTERRGLVSAAEVGLAAVTMATVLGMGRLFAGGEWLPPLAAHAAGAHLVAAVLRRRGAPLGVVAMAMAAGAGLLLTWTSYWSTTAAGVPTGDTLAAMRSDLSVAWGLYQDVVAPAPVETGFVAASALAIWFVAFVADWAAFRLWVPFEATLPAGTLFLFTALLGTERGRAWSLALYAGALLAFLLVHRMARQDSSSHWVADRRALGHRSLVTAGVALGTVAVVAGVAVGPILPGADSPGVLDPRSLRDGADSRVTISPLVDIKSRLVDQAAIEVFQVQSPERAYWRLTSLGRFDGRIWSSSGSYGRADGELPTAAPVEVATASFDQTFTIQALAAIWLPAAYEPRALQIKGTEVRYDDASATLIVDNDVPTSDSITYSVTSASPRISTADLTGTAAEVPDGIRSEFLDLPRDFSPRVQTLAADLTAGATTEAAKARMLQDHLRGFEYSLDVQAGHSGDVLETFLFETQVGYCEQFAGAFAAMARSIGLPARVAVGFTPGEEDPAQVGLYRVRGEYAHAWPEVFIAGAGWVAFEPTPGRGMPYAEGYTGVPEQQAAASQPGTSVTAPPTSAAPVIPADGPSTSIDARDPDANVQSSGSGDDRSAAGLPGGAVRDHAAADRPPVGDRGRPPLRPGAADRPPAAPPTASRPGVRPARPDCAGVAGVRGGGSARRLRGAAQRHLQRACSGPHRRGAGRGGACRRAGVAPRGRHLLARGR